MKVYEALAYALAEEGLDTVFSVSGYGNLDLIVELIENRGARYIAARHEQGAVAMADAYSRVTGRPALCSVTQGPGLTNTPTALTTAVRHRSRVVLFAGDAPRDNRHDIQVLNQRALVEAVGARFVPIRTPATVAEDVQVALRHVRLGGGPAVIDAHVDLQNLEIEGDFSYRSSVRSLPEPQRLRPDPDVVDEAARILREAKRPILLAGRGAAESGARDHIIALAEASGALLATTIQAKDLFRGHPRSLGVAGGLATALVAESLREADCIVAIGASLNAYTTVFGRAFHPSRRLVHIDASADAIGAFLKADVAIVGDAGATAEELTTRLGEACAHAEGAWADETRARLERALQQPKNWAVLDDGLDPRAVVDRLERLLPPERTVVIDGGLFLGFPSTGLSVPDPRGLVFSQDFGAVGLGLGLAIGAALGAPDRHCVAVVGDGGFMMSPQELDTAVRYRIPLTVVVLNDGAYGGEVVQLAAKGKSVEPVLFENPSFSEIARALGAEGKSVETLEDLDVLASPARSASTPLVLDVKTSRQVVHSFVREYTTGAPWRDG